MRRSTMRALGTAQHVFSGLQIDRCESSRRNEGWAQAHLLAPNAKLFVFDKEQVLVARDRSVLHQMQDAVKILSTAVDASELVLLGLNAAEGGATVERSAQDEMDGPQPFPIFACRLQSEIAAETVSEQGWKLLPVRKVMMSVADNAAMIATMGFGKSLTEWHTAAKFCSFCGSHTKNSEVGLSRLCCNSECAQRHYPRVNPCAIMLVLDGKGNCLLGKARGRSGWYSTLAGYMSHGESVEETVCREVQEECGVVVKAVTYHSSQSWPFPFQLMLGCHALADPAHLAITIDPEEIEDAQWFSKADVALALSSQHKSLAVPPLYSISSQLMKAWVEGSVDDFGSPVSRQPSSL